MSFAPHSRVDGPEDAPWIVLSNSLGANLHMWDDQMPLLTQHYRVLRYDVRGHGKSAAPDGPYTFDDLMGDVLGLMDAHQIGRADYMGLSMGAMTGMGLAIHHPRRFRRMVLCDGRADAPPAFRDLWSQRVAAVEAGGLDAIADGVMAMWLNESFRAANPDRVTALRGMVTGNDPAGYAACCEALKTLDYLKDLPRAGVPITYVGGGADKGAPPDVMRAVAAATPGARYVEIPGGGHLPNIDSAAAFNAALSEILDI